MKVSSFEENIFGLPVFRLRLKELEPLSEMLCEYAHDEFRRDREGMVYGPDTAWHSRSSLHEVEELSCLLACVDKSISMIWSRVGWSKTSHPWRHNALWTNISSKTEFTSPHAHWGHAQSNFGGVYYSKALGDCGDLRFYTPDKHLSSIDGFPLNELRPFERVTFFDLRVNTGDLVIFPNWLRHAALPNFSQEERISWTFLSEVTGRGIAAPPLSGLPTPEWSLPDFGTDEGS
jgi:uncharacterized protein (TIGR02466 family)